MSEAAFVAEWFTVEWLDDEGWHKGGTWGSEQLATIECIRWARYGKDTRIARRDDLMSDDERFMTILKTDADRLARDADLLTALLNTELYVSGPGTVKIIRAANGAAEFQWTEALPPPPMPDDWCWSHNRSEPMTENTYRVCGECFHVFPTEADLLADVQEVWDQLGIEDFDTENEHVGPPLNGEHVYSCPHCAHDF